VNCASCGAELPTSRRPRSATAVQAGVPASRGGRPRRFCDERCRKRAARRRAAGLAEDAFVDGARRGRIPLGKRTSGEWRAYYGQVIAELEAAKAELDRGASEELTG
jgi:hypothetical protein